MSSEHGGAGGRGGGTQASATVGKTKRDEKIHAVAGKAAKILNQQLLKPLCRINFGDDQLCPYFEPAAAESKDAVAVANKYKTVLSIPGVKVSKQQFYQDNDLVVPADSDDVLLGQSSGGPQNQNPPGGGPGDDDPDDPDSLDEGAVGGGAKAARARAISISHQPAPSDVVAARKATALADAYRGALAPVREIILNSKSPSEARTGIANFFSDWKPARVNQVTEEALQLCAAAANKPAYA
jgi:phage gp29-like protein